MRSRVGEADVQQEEDKMKMLLGAKLLVCSLLVYFMNQNNLWTVVFVLFRQAYSLHRFKCILINMKDFKKSTGLDRFLFYLGFDLDRFLRIVRFLKFFVGYFILLVLV